jgi:hypothetical protein
MLINGKWDHWRKYWLIVGSMLDPQFELDIEPPLADLEDEC